MLNPETLPSDANCLVHKPNAVFRRSDYSGTDSSHHADILLSRNAMPISDCHMHVNFTFLTKMVAVTSSPWTQGLKKLKETEDSEVGFGVWVRGFTGTLRCRLCPN